MKRKWTKWLSNGLLIIILSIAVVVLFKSNNSFNEPVSLFGVSLFIVDSGSMSPAFNTGDMVIAKRTDADQVSTGEIITFQKENVIVSHRVIELVSQNGDILYRTKGDANNIEDEGLITQGQLLGKVMFHIPKAGFFANFIKTPLGFTTIIGILVLLMAISSLWKYITTNQKRQEEAGS